MDITLEKIDIVRERTGASYREAKEALEKCNGEVVDAIIYLDEGAPKQGKWTETITVAGNEVVDRIKELIKQGNVTKIRIKKDNNTILDIPVTAGAIGTILAPQLAAIGAVVAILSKATLEIERPDKEVINLTEMVEKKAGVAREFIDELAEDAREFLGERRKKDTGKKAGAEQENKEEQRD
jgi:hypothetical protein